jgi:nitrogen fixation NifU-like protein
VSTPSRQVYQDVILDHNRKPRNYGEVTDANRHAEGLNPLCGDHIWLTALVRDEQIEAIAFRGESCAICKASASLMTVSVKGKSVAEAERMIEQFRAITTGSAAESSVAANAVPDSRATAGRLGVFSGIRDLPSRVKCAVLPWHTLRAAFADSGVASTEGEHDPVPE